MSEYLARIVTVNAKRGGELTKQIGAIIANVFAEAKEKLSIEVVHFAICPDCERRRKYRGEAEFLEDDAL